MFEVSRAFGKMGYFFRLIHIVPVRYHKSLTSLYSPGQKHDLELGRMDLVFWQAPIGLFTLTYGLGCSCCCVSVNDSFLTGLIVMFSSILDFFITVLSNFRPIYDSLTVSKNCLKITQKISSFTP